MTTLNSGRVRSVSAAPSSASDGASTDSNVPDAITAATARSIGTFNTIVEPELAAESVSMARVSAPSAVSAVATPIGSV